MTLRVTRLLIAALIWFVPQTSAEVTSPTAPGPLVQIGVFGLFHTKQLIIRPHDGRPVELHCGARTLHIEGTQSIHLTLQAESIQCRCDGRVVQTFQALIPNHDADFTLEVPGKIERYYRGSLKILPSDNELLATVTMSRETAVASIVAAETSSATTEEALKTQAVVTRSYLAAGPRHKGFEFCDTTHCQYLVAPPTPHKAAAQATSATRDIVLTYQSKVVRALYSARCGGETKTLDDVGLHSGHYPYHRVACQSCIRSPDPWTRQFESQQAVRLIRELGSESARLRLVRQLGWQALPSNNYRVSTTPSAVTFQGTGSGHGVGLCQGGAHSMAARAHSFLTILRHYFPNTTLQSSP